MAFAGLPGRHGSAVMGCSQAGGADWPNGRDRRASICRGNASALGQRRAAADKRSPLSVDRDQAAPERLHRQVALAGLGRFADP